MKIIILLSIAFCLIISGINYGQDWPKHNNQDEKDDRKMQSPEERLEKEMNKLTKELELTKMQIPYVRKVLEDTYAKMFKLFSEGNRDETEMKKIMDERDNAMMDILIDDQVTKYAEYKLKRKNRNKQGENNDK